MQSKRDLAYNRLFGELLSGRYPAGERLPSEPDLARMLGVARVTLRAALERLESEGMIQRRRPLGTIVCPGITTPSRIIVLASGDHPENISDPTSYSLEGIREAAHDLGWQIDCIAPSIAHEISWDRLDILGMIICGCNFDWKITWLKKLQATGYPKVLLHGFEHDFKRTGFAAVRTDYHGAWLLGLKHLLDFGHRRIALLNYEPRHLYRRNRMSPKTMLRYLKEYGAEADPELLLESDGKDFEPAVQQIKQMSRPPTAVFCYSDYWALELCTALRRNHLSVPRDLAVMGFGGITAAEFTKPSLSTVDFGYRRQGQLAVELLKRSKEWQDQNPRPVITTPNIVIARESTRNFIINLK